MIRQIGFALSDLAGLAYYWYRTRSAKRGMDARITRHDYGPHRRQYFLLAEPAGAGREEERPWAVYLHGGAWTFGTPDSFLPAARPWLAAGYRVILPSYRRPPLVNLEDIVADCRAAITEAATLARETGRPLGPVQVAGISAGGHLAAVLALHPEWWSAAGWPRCPKQTLLFAAPLDLDLLRPGLLFGKYPAISPCAGPGPDRDSEWLLIHGDRDGMVAQQHSLRFAHHLRRAGARVQSVTIPGGGHLDAGRWTYDEDDANAALIADFIHRGVPVPPGEA
ncbi:acetyl esterase/lipase [Neolewinella xylanilytica]|uniref:Acetyl esterase/lipase n=1 Tax=Neolewinella xylanilytica TaxID=1514080 RepID=A0A2S6I280_9BACT|nr:alpha/beta hydrolase [Neolewinella xylanilytica]PPK85284.1 acetyl esterase/lipase [Neolewinella xylanilytica]